MRIASNIVIPPSLTEADSYPITRATVGRDISGISVINDHATDPVTVVIIDNNGTHTKNVLAGKTYSADYEYINSINVTAGTTYQIELRGL